MLLNKKEIELATQLKNAGLEWKPQVGDWILSPSAHTCKIGLMFGERTFKSGIHEYVIKDDCGVRLSVWLPTLQQSIDGLRSRGYHIVEYREVKDANLVLVGINKDLTTIHDYTVEAKTDLEAMYKLLLEVIKGAGE